MKIPSVLVMLFVAVIASGQAYAKDRVDFKIEVCPVIELYFPCGQDRMSVELDGPEVLDQHGEGMPRLRFAVTANIDYRLRLVPRETFMNREGGLAVKFRSIDGNDDFLGGKVFLDPAPRQLSFHDGDDGHESENGKDSDWLTGFATARVPCLVPGREETEGVGFRGVHTWGIGGVFRADWTAPGLEMAPEGQYRAQVLVEAYPR